ncbi:alkaline phosphatase family protein [Paraburkholderia sp. PREW-6R]|uniref:alkaline phosphatase family protein n=1 Tax=Paraburkholderia sp. PREW-6R TaxID=3141544 RepID=UPI0031F4C516
MSQRGRLRAFLTVVCAALLGLIVAACGSSSSSLNVVGQQKIRHVFVITLENENYATTFGANSKAPYLSQTLASQGAMVQQYYGTGHVSLDNYIAMISGQAPTPETDNDCITFQDFKLTGMTSDGQAIGSGCVYPASIKTLPDQLKAAGYTWKGYEGDMGNDTAREAATCGHPTLNTTDMTQSAEAPSAAVPLGDQYATRHNPFMYFHSIIDSADCGQNVVNLNRLSTDLQSISTTANFNLITPNLCDDGHDAPCVNGQPGGLTSANTFLQKWVPIITASPAFKQDGLLIINFDESSYATVTQPSATVENLIFSGSTCCGQQPGPNLAPFPQTSSLAYKGMTINLTKQSYGGDQTGAVMISPFIKPGTVSTVQYNHYSMLRSIEDIFQLSHLGYAGQAGLVGFGNDIFTNL